MIDLYLLNSAILLTFALTGKKIPCLCTKTEEHFFKHQPALYSYFIQSTSFVTKKLSQSVGRLVPSRCVHDPVFAFIWHYFYFVKPTTAESLLTSVGTMLKQVLEQ